MIRSGAARICPTCNGEGKCKTPTIVGYTGTGGLGWHGDAIRGSKLVKCSSCNGKGYQLKTEEWK